MRRHPEALTSATTEAVAPPLPPLTVSFVGVPAEHDGKTEFSFKLRFSENFPGYLPYKKLREEALRATNGRVVDAECVQWPMPGWRRVPARCWPSRYRSPTNMMYMSLRAISAEDGHNRDDP